MGAFTVGPQIHEYRRPEESDMRAREIERDDLGNPVGGSMFEDLFRGGMPGFGEPSPAVMPPTPSPGQEPPPLPGQEQDGDHKQYFDAMRTNIDGLSEAFKQIENLSMPGGQHGGKPPPSQGGGVGKGGIGEAVGGPAKQLTPEQLKAFQNSSQSMFGLAQNF